MMNPFQKLLGPTNKLAEFAEVQLKEIKALNVITLDIKKQSKISNEELAKQTVILTDIKKLIKKQIDSTKTKGSTAEFGDASKFKGLSPEKAGQLAAIVIGSMVAITVAAALIQYVPSLSVGKLLTVIAVAGALALVVPAFLKIAKELNNNTKGLAMNPNAGLIGSSAPGLKGVGVTTLALIGMSVTILLSSLLFQLIVPLSIQQALTAILISLTMVGLAISMGKIVKALRDSKITGMKGVMAVEVAGLAMVAGITALVASSFILQALQPISYDQFIGMLAIGIGLIPLAYSFGIIIKALGKAKVTGMKGVQMVVLAGLAMIAMGGAIVGISYIFQLLPDGKDFKAPPLLWSLIVGLSMVAFAYSFSTIMKAIKGASLKDIAFGTVATVLVAVAMLGAAFVLMLFPENTKAPEADWSLKTGLAIAMFAIPFALLTILFKSMNIDSAKDVGLGALGIIGVTVALVAVAYIFKLLPDEYKDPPKLAWVLGSAAALFVFAVPVAAVTAIVALSGGVGFLLGIVGVILIAAALLAVAYIFKAMPDLGAIGANITSFILAPVNGMIDVLGRLKNEIGVDNLLPLAGGIAAISLSLLLLAGATAGIAAGGVLAALGSGAKALMDGVLNFFGAEKSKGPLDILDELIKKRDGIELLVDPLKNITNAIVGIISIKDATNIATQFIYAIHKCASKIRLLAKPLVSIAASFTQIVTQPIKKVQAATTMFKTLSDSSFDKQDKALKSIATSVERISAGSNTMNIEAIDSSTKMFQALAYLSANGRENAVAELGSALVDAIGELGDIMGEFANTVSDGIGDTKTMFKNSVGQGTSINRPSTSSAPVNIDLRQVTKAIRNLEARLIDDGIKVKRNQ